MFSPIAISLSPNTEKDDVFLAFKVLFQPWRWMKGREIKKVEEWFKEYFRVKEAIFFNSGRSALYAVLKSLDVGKGDEVLIQSFTCVAVPDPILWVGAKPVYVDIEKNTYNMDIADLEKKISKNSKAIIVQHTFGIPARIGKIKKIAEKHNLVLIEDCAHALGGSFLGRKLGTFGDVSFFSFGRDKMISSVFGGMAIINSKFEIRNSKFKSKIKKYQKKLAYPTRRWVSQQLLHPIAFALILPFYNFFNLGKILLVFLQKLRLLSLPVSRKEKYGGRPKIFPKRFSNGLAILALNQLKKLERFNQKRKEITYFYQKNLKSLPLVFPEIKEEGLPLLRFPILTEKTPLLRNFAKKRSILLGNWYSHIIDPEGVNLEKVGYRKGSCPEAEKAAGLIVNLPTYPKLSQKKIEKVVDLVKDFFKKERNISMKLIKNKSLWENYLLSVSPQSFFQSWNWGEVEKSLGKKVWRVGIYEKVQSSKFKVQRKLKLIGISQIVKVVAKRGIFLHVRHGPVFKEWNKENFKKWLQWVKNIAKDEKAAFIRISPLIKPEKASLMKKMGFRDAPIHNMDAEVSLVLKLDKEKEELLKNMRKTTRNLIRKAKRIGVFILKGKSDKDLKIFLELFYQTAKRGHFIFERGIEEEIKIFSKEDKALIFLGGYKGKILAGAVIAFYGNQGIYRYAASSKDLGNIPVSYLIQWEAIKETKKRGLKLYNLWGGIALGEDKNHPWYGLTLFKKGFGGQITEYLHAQDLPLTLFYWKTFMIEKMIKILRGYSSFKGLRVPSWIRKIAKV